MKLALLIAGYLRCFIENIDSIKKYLIKNNDCDIYIHVTENEYELDSKYFNKKISIEYIISQLNPKILLISDNFKFSDNKIINNLLNQNYKFYWLNEERKKISFIEKINYDIVIKIRPDVNLLNELNYDIDLNYIYIPSDDKIDKKKLLNENDNHICDIIAYSNTKNMDKYFDFYLYIFDLIKIYGIINETLLYYYLENYKIKYKLIDINYVVILSLLNTIAICGDSGSGKTTLSKIIKELFNNSFILECDRYHKWERDDKNWNNYTHLNPDANYITKMATDVFNLKIGNDIYQIDYDHNNGKFTDKVLIEKKDNIIVCGLHSLYLPEHIVNIKIYIDTDKNLKIPWKIKRDILKRGYSLDKIINQIKIRESDYLKYILPQKDKSDIIINFYTDKEFNLENFNINEEIKIFFRIGIKKCFNVNKLINNINFIEMKNIDNFVYFYFNNFEDYTNIIKNIFINLF